MSILKGVIDALGFLDLLLIIKHQTIGTSKDSLNLFMPKHNPFSSTLFSYIQHMYVSMSKNMRYCNPICQSITHLNIKIGSTITVFTNCEKYLYGITFGSLPWPICKSNYFIFRLLAPENWQRKLHNSHLNNILSFFSIVESKFWNFRDTGKVNNLHIISKTFDRSRIGLCENSKINW